eukprot:5167375-Pyramimonas_sp.AAC.1
MPMRGRLQYPMVRDGELMIADPLLPAASPPMRECAGHAPILFTLEGQQGPDASSRFEIKLAPADVLTLPQPEDI